MRSLAVAMVALLFLMQSATRADRWCFVEGMVWIALGGDRSGDGFRAAGSGTLALETGRVRRGSRPRSDGKRQRRALARCDHADRGSVAGDVPSDAVDRGLQCALGNDIGEDSCGSGRRVERDVGRRHEHVKRRCR